MRKLQALLKAILLRRTKKSKIDGRSILDLPERTTEQSHAVFSDDELAFYQALETHTQLTFNKYLKANTVGRNYSNILVLLLRLRQAVSARSMLWVGSWNILKKQLSLLHNAFWERHADSSRRLVLPSSPH